MTAYIVRRLLQVPIVLIAVTFIVFLLLRLSGDPALVLAGDFATGEDIQQIRKSLGLDRPLWYQYALFLSRVARGDFGRSLFLGGDAFTIVRERLPNTLQLAGLSMAVSVVFGLSLGIIAGTRRGTWTDQIVMLIATFGQAVAQFWFALILMLILAVWMGILPVSGKGGPSSFVMPVMATSFTSVALMARLSRSGILEVLRQDYIRTAHAKGLNFRLVISRHALRNALIPLITVMGTSLAAKLAGAAVIESIFAWPGIGQLVLESIGRRDYPVILTVVILIATMFVLINLIVDVLYGFIDPRIREGRGG